MSAQSKLIELAELGFSMAGESVPLGFDIDRISPTLSKLRNGLDSQLQSLFEKAWPSDFFLGMIEFIGPDRINSEHAELYPGLTLIQHGFICIGSDGTGTMYSYCPADQRVYLFSPDYFSDNGIVSHSWGKLETNAGNIKTISINAWDSLELLFDWALVELRKLGEERNVDS